MRVRTRITRGALTAALLALLAAPATVVTSAAPAGAATGDVKKLSLKNPNNSAFSFSAGGLRTAALANGALYAVDAGANKIFKVTLATNRVTTFAGTGASCDDQTAACGDGGVATSAQLNAPNTIFSDGSNLYINDLFGARIRKVSLSSNIITTVVGTGVTGYSGDGGAATSAQIGGIITGMAVNTGKLYFSDTLNEVIRCVGCSGAGVISTVVGSGAAVDGSTTPPAAGDAPTAANLMGPMGLAIEPVTGNLVFADGCSFAAAFASFSSYCDSTVWRLNGATNQLEVVAGTPGTVGSSGMGGPATSATLRTPSALSYRIDGTLLIGEFGGSLLEFLMVANGASPTDIYGDGSNVGLYPGVRCVGCAGAGLISRWAGGNLLDPANFASRNVTRLNAILGTPNIVSDPATGHVYFSDQFFSEIRRIEEPVTKPDLKVSFSTTRYNVVRSTASTTNEVAVPITLQNRGVATATGPVTLTITLTPPSGRSASSLLDQSSAITTANAGAFTCNTSGTNSETITCTSSANLATVTGGAAPVFTLHLSQTTTGVYGISATATTSSTDKNSADNTSLRATVNVRKS